MRLGEGIKVQSPRLQSGGDDLEKRGVLGALEDPGQYACRTSPRHSENGGLRSIFRPPSGYLGRITIEGLDALFFCSAANRRPAGLSLGESSRLPWSEILRGLNLGCHFVLPKASACKLKWEERANKARQATAASDLQDRDTRSVAGVSESHDLGLK